jgi:hypothetical protein
MYDSATLDELLPVPAEKRGLLATDTVSVPAAPVVNNLKVTLALVLIQVHTPSLLLISPHFPATEGKDEDARCRWR